MPRVVLLSKKAVGMDKEMFDAAGKVATEKEFSGLTQRDTGRPGIRKSPPMTAHELFRLAVEIDEKNRRHVPARRPVHRRYFE